MNEEIEIKLEVDDLDKEIEKITRLGATLVHNFEFEDNLIFDFKDRSLKNRGTVLRIRAYGDKCTTTLKEKVSEESRYKIRSEVEMGIDDPDSLKKIFQSLGLQVVYRYQKYRSEYHLGDLHICCDRTPIGNFLELEGKKEDIDNTALSLGYSKNDYINISYLAYHMKYLESKGIPLENMLFKDK
jgi:adenylate cyclase class 2